MGIFQKEVFTTEVFRSCGCRYSLGFGSWQEPRCFQLLSVPALWIALATCSSSYSQHVALLAVTEARGYNLDTLLLGLLQKIQWAGEKSVLHVEKIWHIRLLMPLYRKGIFCSAWNAQNNCGDRLALKCRCRCGGSALRLLATWAPTRVTPGWDLEVVLTDSVDREIISEQGD